MFGCIQADLTKLSKGHQQRYSACYCGLCRCLKQHGLLARLTLNYDMTFLALLLSSMYEPEETSGEARCMAHPMKSRPYSYNRITQYTADMNIALAYFKAVDDWSDDKNLPKRIFSLLLQSRINQLENKYTRQFQAVRSSLAALSALEKENRQDPDAAAAAFGALTEELFVIDTGDYWADALRRLGNALGRFIYLSDAVLDLEDDRKKQRYNPLLSLHDDPMPYLEMTAGDCAAELEKLPLVQDLEILRNIIYSGIWIPHARKKKMNYTRRKSHV